MAGRISISRKAAQAIVDALSLDMCHAQQYEWAFDALESALRPKPKKPLRLVREAAKKAKKASKREETSAIYEAARRRAGNHCECCSILLIDGHESWMAPELDHAWGRGKAPQSVQNCWILSRICHRDKTNNKPSAKYWLEKFRNHCLKHGYTAEASKAQRKLDALEMMEEAEGAR